jgi:hypothetical protein
LLKRAEVARTEDVNAGGGDHPEGAVDAKDTRIASDNVTDPEGPVAADGAAIVSVVSIDQTREPEV